MHSDVIAGRSLGERQKLPLLFFLFLLFPPHLQLRGPFLNILIIHKP